MLSDSRQGIDEDTPVISVSSEEVEESINLNQLARKRLSGEMKTLDEKHVRDELLTEEYRVDK